MKILIKILSIVSKFFIKTKCPILVNTSFNVRGEPIVCTASDAFKCFMGTELDVLVIDILFSIKMSKIEFNKWL